MKLLKFVIPLLLVLTLLLPQALLPARVLADDTLVDIDITSPWSIIAWIDLNSPNVTLYLDGVPFQQIVNQAIGQAVSAAVRQSVPNGIYSGVSSPGWEGYFGFDSNIKEYSLVHFKKDPATGNPMIDPATGEPIILDVITMKVYTGAGCGGKWGTSDGWPDFWGRRQLIGFLFLVRSIQWQIEDMVGQMNVLETRVAILEASDNVTRATLASHTTDIELLQADVKTLKGLNIDDRLTRLEAENRAQNTNIIILYIIASLALAAVIALSIFLFLRRRY